MPLVINMVADPVHFLISLLFPVSCPYLNLWSFPFVLSVEGGERASSGMIFVGLLNWRIPFLKHDIFNKSTRTVLIKELVLTYAKLKLTDVTNIGHQQPFPFVCFDQDIQYQIHLHCPSIHLHYANVSRFIKILERGKNSNILQKWSASEMWPDSVGNCL